MIEFFFDTVRIEFEKLKPIEEVLEQILLDYGYTLNYINVILMMDEELLEINREFLKHDFYTDIITFNYAEEPETIEAELYISLDRVKDNAVKLGIDMYNELNRVIIHGTLHLVGFKDETKELKESMQVLEDKYIKTIVPRETL